MKFTNLYLATHWVLHRGLLRRGSCAATARLQVLEDNIVRKHINRQLLVAELVETGHFVARGRSDLVGDLLTCCKHGNHGRLKLGLRERDPLHSCAKKGKP